MSGMKSGRQHNKGGNYHAKNQNKQSSSKALQKRNKAYKSHILTKKSTKRKRNLRQSTITDATNVKNMKKVLPYL